MANSKKKAVTKPAAKKPAAPAKKTTPAKTPTKLKATKPASAAKSKTKPAAAKTPAKKTPPKQTVAKATKAVVKPSSKTTTAAKGSRLQLGKSSAAKASKKSSTAKKVSDKSSSPVTPVTTPAVKKTIKKSEPTTLARPAVAKPALRTSSGGSVGSVRRTALAAEPLPSGTLAGKKLRTPPARPISFTLDEVRAIAKSNETKSEPAAKAGTGKSSAKKTTAAAAPTKSPKPIDVTPPAKPSHVAAASLADILGFNPNAKGPEAAGPVPREVALVPEKFKRYYKLLVELREHLTGQIDQHSEDTLKRSSKDDAGDLSSYGQHMADAGTDTFDRDFALSLVSSEQEALSEIEAAIKRITDGSYGVCEVTGQAIAKARLLAVPFTRYSAEAQKEIERNHYRVRTQAGLFGELGGEDGGKIMDADGD